MADKYTMIRVSTDARDKAEALAQSILTASAANLPQGVTLNTSQGKVVEQALNEFIHNHPELGVK